MKRSWPNCMVLLRHSPGGIEENHENPQDSRCRYSNLGPSASYSGDRGYKSQPGDMLSWRRFSWFFSGPQDKCWDSTLKLGYCRLLPYTLSNSSFTFHSFVLRNIVSVDEKASLNKQQTNVYLPLDTALLLQNTLTSRRLFSLENNNNLNNTTCVPNETAQVLWSGCEE
jgi:hypothetical protein